MPPVVVGVVAAAGAYAAGATLVTVVAIGLAAASLYSVATMDIPSAQGTDPQSAKQMIRSSNQPYRGYYGTAMGSGPIVFAEEFQVSKKITEKYKICTNVPGQGRQCQEYDRVIEAGDKWMHVVIALAGHQVDSITKVFFDDEEKTEWNHEFWKITAMDGSQTSINDIPQALRDVTTWTDTMIGEGLAWVHVMMKYSADHFPNGIPNIKCVINGRQVQTPFFNGFTNNAAAVIYDYLKFHFKVPDKMINAESFKSEYPLCQEAMINETLPDGRTPIRYAIDGGFDYDETHENILNKMLTACGGQLNYVHGQYYLQVAAYRGPVGSKQHISLNDLTDSIDISPDTNLSDRINTVRGTYVDPTQGYQPVDFAEVSNPTYVAEDGEIKAKDVSYEYIHNVNQAHRLSNISLKDNRFGLTIVTPLNMRGFKYNVGLPVGFDDAHLGYDALEFRVVNWKVKPGKGVTLTIKQTHPDIYDDSVQNVKPKPPSPNLPDPKHVDPVSDLNFISLADDNVYDGLVTWTHPDLNSVRDFELVYSSAEGDTSKMTTTDTVVRLQDMQGVEYTIVVVAINEFGSRSQPVTLTQRIGEPKPITSVVFKPENFSMVINPVVSGALPINTEFLFYRGQDGVSPPDFAKADYLGSGRTFVDTGLKSKTLYNYFIQVSNTAAITDAFGPYPATTTDNPKDIMDVIGPSIPGTYTWIVYASDAFGADISRSYDPNIHKFEGRAYNKDTKTPSLNPLDYVFVRIGEFVDPEDQKILDNLANGKLPDGSGDLVTEDDILFKPGDKVQAVNIEHDAVTTDKIAHDAVTTEKVSGEAITADKIKTNSITATQIAAETITSNEIKAGTIQAEDIKANTITSAQIAAETITSNEIKAGTIQAEDIKANTITSAQIKAEAITANEIASETITAGNIAANAITAAKLDAGSVTATKIAANAITADKIAANAITSTKIAANAITAEKIAVTVVEPINNWSQWDNLRGWTMDPVQTTLVTDIKLDNRTARTLRVRSKASEDVNIVSDQFTVDHNAIYEFRLSIYCDQPANTAEQGWGIRGFDTDGNPTTLEMWHPTATPTKTGESTTPDFWKGSVTLSGVTTGWRHMVAYVVGAAASMSSVPVAINVDNTIKLGADTEKLSIVDTIYKIAGIIQDSHLYSPSGVKLGSGVLTASEIKAGVSITAPKIFGSTITGGSIIGTTFNNGNGTFEVDENGNVRQGSTLITGTLDVKASNANLYVGMQYASSDAPMFSAGYTAAGNHDAYKFCVTPAGRVISKNNNGSVMMDLNPSSGIFRFFGEVQATKIVGDITSGAIKTAGQVKRTTAGVTTMYSYTIRNGRPWTRYVQFSALSMEMYLDDGGGAVSTSIEARVRYVAGGITTYTTTNKLLRPTAGASEMSQTFSIPPVACKIPANWTGTVTCQLDLSRLRATASYVILKAYATNNYVPIMLLSQGGDIS